MELTLNGKVALVTGARQGNGKAVADYLENLGAIVVRSDIQAGDALLPMDVTDEESVAAAMRSIREKHGRLDILVNNAGIINKAAIPDIDIAAWRSLIDVNLTGPTICSKHASHLMKANNWGRIINISSVQAYLANETYSAYAASKAALSHLTHIWAKELAPWNITVNALCPSYVDTPMMANTINTWAAKLNSSREAALDHLLTPIPGKRLLKPEELGYWTAVLATDMGSGVTGANISLSCGWLLY